MVLDMAHGLDGGYDFSSVREFLFGGSSPRRGEVKQIVERLPTLQKIIQSMYFLNMIYVKMHFVKRQMGVKGLQGSFEGCYRGVKWQW